MCRTSAKLSVLPRKHVAVAGHTWHETAGKEKKVLLAVFGLFRLLWLVVSEQKLGLLLHVPMLPFQPRPCLDTFS